MSQKPLSNIPKVAVIIPSWNGAAELPAAIESVLAQSHQNLTLVIVDNGSTDDSREIIARYQSQDERVEAILRDKNYGFTGGVNPGFQWAIDHNYDYAAPLNNDAVADKNWLAHLLEFLENNENYGIAACQLLHEDGRTFDSTGDMYTVWGLPWPRGRDEPVAGNYTEPADIFGASGGASLYRVKMLAQIGFFDDDFFAYYEDIDLSFRAQLAGWKVRYVPKSVVYHMEGVTRKKMLSSFATTQTLKNLPLVVWKNIPRRFLFTVGWRYLLAHTLFFGRAVQRGYFWPALKADARATWLLLAKWPERRRIQKSRTVSDAYIWSILTHDLPDNARNLRRLRAKWWKVTRRNHEPHRN